jgi:hypothetical protein
MTVTTLDIPNLPAVIDPVLPQAVHSRCTYCWQKDRRGINLTADATNEHAVRRLCTSCDRDLRAGRTPALTVEQRAQAWEWLAHQHINDRAGMETGVTDTVIDRALRDLAPHLTPEQGWQTVEDLVEALLTIADAEDRCTILDSATIGPDHDPETYINHWKGHRDDAVRKLTGAAR